MSVKGWVRKSMSSRLAFVWALMLSLTLMSGCVPGEESLLTEPCEEECNDEAAIGAPCEAAEDCATGDACNLGFVGGYCQGSCGEGSTAAGSCGEDDAGRCLPKSDGEGLACVVGCDPTNINSCERTELACYDIGESAGACLGRCTADDQCGSGFGCDGQGLCRSGGANCDGLTNAGCPEGQGCYLTAEGASFCGLFGTALRNQACSRVAGCVEGHWCIEGTCRVLCATDDFNACGNRAALCTPVIRGFRLGFCRQ